MLPFTSSVLQLQKYLLKCILRWRKKDSVRWEIHAYWIELKFCLIDLCLCWTLIFFLNRESHQFIKKKIIWFISMGRISRRFSPSIAWKTSYINKGNSLVIWSGNVWIKWMLSICLIFTKGIRISVLPKINSDDGVLM